MSQPLARPRRQPNQEHAPNQQQSSSGFFFKLRPPLCHPFPPCPQKPNPTEPIRTQKNIFFPQPHLSTPQPAKPMFPGTLNYALPAKPTRPHAALFLPVAQPSALSSHHPFCHGSPPFCHRVAARVAFKKTSVKCGLSRVSRVQPPGPPCPPPATPPAGLSSEAQRRRKSPGESGSCTSCSPKPALPRRIPALRDEGG